jgi:hypothetical protein
MGGIRLLSQDRGQMRTGAGSGCCLDGGGDELTCFAGDREGESEGRGWVRLLGELDPEPGRESKTSTTVIIIKGPDKTHHMVDKLSVLLPITWSSLKEHR